MTLPYTSQAGLGEYFNADIEPWGPWHITQRISISTAWVILRTRKNTAGERVQLVREPFASRADAERVLALIALGAEPDIVDDHEWVSPWR